VLDAVRALPDGAELMTRGAGLDRDDLIEYALHVLAGRAS
jgi:hypothetical protein